MPTPADQPDVPAPTVQVVRRSEIPATPATTGPENDAGTFESRAFHRHPAIHPMLPDAGRLEFDWVHLDEHQSIDSQADDRNSLIVVIDGSAAFVGPQARTVARDHIVAIPAHSRYRIDAAAGGFVAIVIHYPASAQDPRAVAGSGAGSSLEDLLAHNERRLAATKKNPFFTVLSGGEIRDAASRRTYVDCIQLFSNVFQKIILGRQAMCRDPAFEPVFLAHMADELGHNELLAARPDAGTVTDPVLRATADWFAHQMFVLDNAEKAALVHLVLESAGHHFHTLAQEEFATDAAADYYRVHAEDDEEHTEMGLGPLRDLHPRDYQRLIDIVDEGWNMFDAMTCRISELALATQTSAERAKAR